MVALSRKIQSEDRRASARLAINFNLCAKRCGRASFTEQQRSNSNGYGKSSESGACGSMGSQSK